ncbi:uncharacterized protein LOC120015691 [Tripterygium wilfordii]|uniref:uncharacterized protein LOC120015691 n=1 Tax=Tripterygium wilfordii TaxID=458696 RepID=UPI0018F82EEF|nr:uncharacterized protein LOC120015691 [Tripterygium wilfordii]XP_038724149.1 uncharacterized protein LOC120015691 [Tripterygium wilfordii]
MKTGFKKTRVLSDWVYGKDHNVDVRENVKRGRGEHGFCTGIDFVSESTGKVNSMRNYGFVFEGREIEGEREMDLVEISSVNPPCPRFEAGDMVWGKVESYPWWPGQIFNKAFAVPSVHNEKIEGHALVAFFGDDSYGWFDPLKLIPFDYHYAEKLKQTKSRSFVNAVQEAEIETARRASLGLSCWCRDSNFRHTGVEGFLAVDLVGYAPGGVYSVKQIKKAREGFCALEMLKFLQHVALKPCWIFHETLDRIKALARVLAYRRAVFEEFDDTYVHAFGAQQEHSVNNMKVLDKLNKVPCEALLSKSLRSGESSGVRKSSVSSMKVNDQVNIENYLSKKKDDPEVRHLSKSSSILSTYKEKSALVPVSLKVNFLGQEYKNMNSGFVDRAGSVLTSKEAAPMKKKSPHQKISSITVAANREARRTESVNRSQVEQAQPGWSKVVEHQNGLANVPEDVNSIRDLPFALKPPKKRLKPENASMAGQSDINPAFLKTSNRLKRPNKLKSFAAEKKIEIQKPVKSHGNDGKSMNTTVSVQQNANPNPFKKLAAPTRVAPKVLLMQFPRHARLPSVSELKARFARYGFLDHSPPPCVFWKSSTCRVVFECEADAQVAYQYAISNSSMFGKMKVYYYLEDLNAPKFVLPTSQKENFEKPSSTCGDSPKPKSTDTQQLVLHPRANLESCLKNPLVYELSGPSEKLQVNLFSGGDDAGAADQLMVNSSILKSEGNHSSLPGATISTTTSERGIRPVLSPGLEIKYA